MKKAILIVAVGAATSQGQAGLKTFSLRVESAFPDLPVRLALTSERIRNRLAQQGKKSDSVEKALRKLHYEKFSHVAVQPLYSLAGVEYEEITRTAAEFQKSYPGLRVKVGRPLLACPDDVTGDPMDAASSGSTGGINETVSSLVCRDNSDELQAVAKALLGFLPAARKPAEPVIWMGHGSRHAADSAYATLGAALRRLDPQTFVATMDGSANLGSVLQSIKRQENSLDLAPRVWLLPLLSIIGRHALEDMAGTSPDSWKSLLEAQGFTVNVVLSGLAENEDIAAIWVERLAEAVEAF